MKRSRSVPGSPPDPPSGAPIPASPAPWCATTTSSPSDHTGKYPYTTDGSTTPSVRIRSYQALRRGRPSVSTSSSYDAPSSPRPGLSPHWPMNVARSSRNAAYSASWTPLTRRVPQNGGAGTGLSAATSDRAGRSSTGVSVTVTTACRRFFSAGSPTASGDSPRATRTSGSMRRRPSNASRAYRTTPGNWPARSSST
ncbi:Uncharacterised protein [Mycobacteroides abscessus]|nr:Uncharacterised protein [Mycobacteroides abscessus]